MMNPVTKTRIPNKISPFNFQQQFMRNKPASRLPAYDYYQMFLRNELYNDDVYEYDSIGIPFFSSLSREILNLILSGNYE